MDGEFTQKLVIFSREVLDELSSQYFLRFILGWEIGRIYLIKIRFKNKKN